MRTFVFQQLPVGGATANHPPPSNLEIIVVCETLFLYFK